MILILYTSSTIFVCVFWIILLKKMNLCDSPTYTYWHVGIKCMFPIFQQHSRLSLFGWCYKRTTTCIRIPKITRKKKQKQIKHMHCLLTYIILDLAQFVSISVSPWRRVYLPQLLYFHAVSAVACFAWLHEAYPTWWTAGRTETTAVKGPTRIITNNLQQQIRKVSTAFWRFTSTFFIFLLGQTPGAFLWRHYAWRSVIHLHRTTSLLYLFF